MQSNFCNINMLKVKALDLIMSSFFDGDGGGRETWAYNFIPLLLRTQKNLQLFVYGMSREEHNNSQCLLDKVDVDDRDRIKMKFFRIANNKKIPFFLSMLINLRRYCRVTNKTSPELVLGVGGLYEMLMLLLTPKYKFSKKMLWLRTIFLDENATRVPKWLLFFLRKVETFILSKADILLANGDDIQAYYQNLGLKVGVVKNGVDAKRWFLSPPQLKLPLKVAFIGRLTPVKGIDVFIDLVKKIKQTTRGNEFEFHVIGDGPSCDLVKRNADVGLLLYHGKIANIDLLKYLNLLDICVAFTFALSANGFGGGGTSNALLEQMAASRVIIAWDNAIFRQLLSDKTAYLVKEGDVNGLETVLWQIAANLTLAEQKAKFAREEVQQYSLEKQMEKFFLILNNFGLCF